MAAVDGTQPVRTDTVGEASRGQISRGWGAEGSCWQLKSRDLPLGRRTLGQKCLEEAGADQGDFISG